MTESTICTFLKKANFTRQRLKLYAIQRDEFLRAQFITDVSLYSKDMLVFLDETGTDRRDTIRKKGYSLRGKPIRAQRLLAKGEHISVICAMCVDEIMCCKIERGSVDGESFVDFLEKSLMPNLMPFNGYNPRSVVIMDNCSIHHVDHVSVLLQQIGVLIQWLPPYSPDFNPLEEAFSKVKLMMKAMEAEMQANEDIDTVVYSAFSCITSQDCLQWVKNSAIYK